MGHPNPSLSCPNFFCCWWKVHVFFSHICHLHFLSNTSPPRVQNIKIELSSRQNQQNQHQYCWWKKSCTSWLVVYPIILQAVSTIPGGKLSPDFWLPSTVSLDGKQWSWDVNLPLRLPSLQLNLWMNSSEMTEMRWPKLMMFTGLGDNGICSRAARSRCCLSSADFQTKTWWAEDEKRESDIGRWDEKSWEGEWKVCNVMVAISVFRAWKLAVLGELSFYASRWCSKDTELSAIFGSRDFKKLRVVFWFFDLRCIPSVPC